MVTIDLCPGGSEKAVTEANKAEYVDAVVEYRIAKRVKDQFSSFMTGLNELVPQDLLQVFDERELELLIGGLSEIDVYVTTRVLYDLRTDVAYIVMIGTSSPTIEAIAERTRLSNGSGQSFGAGLTRRSFVCCNLQQELRGFLLLVLGFVLHPHRMRHF